MLCKGNRDTVRLLHFIYALRSMGYLDKNFIRVLSVNLYYTFSVSTVNIHLGSALRKGFTSDESECKLARPTWSLIKVNILLFNSVSHVISVSFVLNYIITLMIYLELKFLIFQIR